MIPQQRTTNASFRSGTNLGELPQNNHKFESVGGVLETLNHEILKAFFERKRVASKASRLENDS